MSDELGLSVRVQTKRPDIPTRGWTPEALESQKWGVSGKITQRFTGHGLCYEVLHDDGTVGFYEPHELVPS